MINQIKKIKLFNIMTIDKIIITINLNKSYKKKKIISKTSFVQFNQTNELNGNEFTFFSLPASSLLTFGNA